AGVQITFGQSRVRDRGLDGRERDDRAEFARGELVFVLLQRDASERHPRVLVERVEGDDALVDGTGAGRIGDVLFAQERREPLRNLEVFEVDVEELLHL